MKHNNKNLTWKETNFENILGQKRKNRIIGMTFPVQDTTLGLEPSILTVLPEGDNVEYAMKNIDYNNDDVQYYLCSVYITGYDEFKQWAQKHDKTKIVVGGIPSDDIPGRFPFPCP